jgi:hypothetical protein
MIIVSGFRHNQTQHWNRMLDAMKASAEKVGHKAIIYDLPTQDRWIGNQYELLLSLCWKYKVIFMHDILDQQSDDVVWVDGDCLVINPIDFNKAIDGCDLAFTLRDVGDRNKTRTAVQDGYLNSGVVFIRNNSRSREFMKLARKQVTLSLYDQEAFNKILLEASALERHGEVINIYGIKVKILNCREYNNFYFDEGHRSAKILHFKGRGRSIWHEYIREYLGWNIQTSAKSA